MSSAQLQPHTMRLTSSASLTSIPPDIILSIAEYLDPATLLNLRLISHALNAVITPLALRSISISLDGTKKHIIGVLNSSPPPLPGIYRHAKHLTIRTHESFIAEWVKNTRTLNVYKMVEQLKSLASLRSISWDACRGDAHKTQIENIYTMIEQLESLTSLHISWDTFHNDTQQVTTFVHEIQERIVEAVLKATGGRLRDLVVEPWILRMGSPLDLPRGLMKFRGLRSLGLTVDEHGWRCSAVGMFNPFERHNRRQHFVMRCIPPSYQADLQMLIQENPKLERLSVKQGCPLDLHDAETLLAGNGIQALSLRTLRVKGINFPHRLTTQPSPFSHLQELEVLSNYSALPLDNLWSSLQAAGSKLKRLRTHQVSYPLVIYLSSYSGLQELVIKDIEYTPQCVSHKTTELFFTKTLLQHSSTLTDLSISFDMNIEFLEGWSFSPSLWMPALVALKRLKSLSLYPGNEQRFTSSETEQMFELEVMIDEDDEVEDNQERATRDTRKVAVTRNYQEVLLHIELLHELETLQISWPKQWFGCGTGYIQWSRSYRRLLTEVSKDLRSSTGSPKVLRMLSGTYDARRCEAGGDWEYIPRESEQRDQY